MSIIPKTHEVTMSIVKSKFKEMENGTEINLIMHVTCSQFCDLRGKAVTLTDRDGEQRKVEITEFNGVENATDEITVKTGTEAGEYTWKAEYNDEIYVEETEEELDDEGAEGEFSDDEATDDEVNENEEIVKAADAVTHLSCSALFSFTFRPHTVSMAVWDMPVAISTDASFKIKIGGKCSTECNLAGNAIEVTDHNNSVVASSKFNEATWEGTHSLYWTEVELKAPSEADLYTWNVRYIKPDDDTPHGETLSTFNFRVVTPPDCKVKVEVLEKGKLTPLENADVVLHPYNIKTDKDGKAEFMLTKGEYQFYVIVDDKFERYKSILNVPGDIDVKVEMVRKPDYIPDF